jgi:hypothetical protein
MNGNGKRKAIDDDALSWDYAVSKLIDEANSIRAALEEIQELHTPDLSACVTLWSLQFQGLQLVGQGDADPSVRDRFEAALAERRKVMDALLAKTRAQSLRRAS